MTKLSEMFTVKSRFHRSVQIEYDRALEDYILTQVGVKTVRRIVESFDDSLATKAWSVVGPYGSGKSAFILYLKTLLGPSNDSTTIHARKLLKTKEKKLHEKLFVNRKRFKANSKGFCRALVCAGRERLEYAILKGLYNGVDEFFKLSTTRKQPQILTSLSEALNKANKGKYPSNDEIINFCKEAVQYVKKSKGEGIVLVVDELGKTLENAALDQENDIFILQKIAEYASRSDNFPFLFFTVLHQSFNRYASKLDTEKRNEWAKIQGRFEDISFVDESDQVFQIIASTIIDNSNKNEKKILKAQISKSSNSFRNVLDNAGGHYTERFYNVIDKCVPLHPLTTLALVPLFRSKFSQNERSLFAFITSTESYGLINHLSSSRVNQDDPFPFYRLDNVYDYFVANFGTNLYIHHHSRKWIEIDNALQRSHDTLERTMIKIIGILDILSDSLNINANEETIFCALDAYDQKTQKKVRETIKNLQRKSVIVYRRYISSYRIWGGSDIDIEQKIEEHKNANVDPIEFVHKLNKYFPLRPKVAKRHLFQTGTLRYFCMRFVADIEFEETVVNPIENADGQVLFVIPFKKLKIKNKGRRDDLRSILNNAQNSIKEKTLVGVLKNADRLVSSFVELLTLHTVKEKTKELQSDKIARREINARIADMEHIVSALADELFFQEFSQSKQNTLWFDDYKYVDSISKKQLSIWLSDICDRIYSKSPNIKNELINRSRVSTTASSARRLLINAILEKSDKSRLGIEGYPAEYGIYLSVLVKSGLHQIAEDGKGYIPKNSSQLEKTWRPLWKYLQTYLDKNSYRKVRLTELYSKLQSAPYGLREGILPIVFAAFVKAFENELALFENGTFLPKVRNEDFELIAKSPKNYEVQLCRIQGVKAAIFDQILDSFLSKKLNSDQKEKITLLHIVKMLCEFVKTLPQYVKTTVHLSDKARAVRKCLLEAKEPASLLYNDLPKACGAKISNNKGDINSIAETYIDRLRLALRELQRKEGDLYSEIEKILFNSFDIRYHGQDQRKVIVERTDLILNMTLDPIFKGFLVRVVDSLEYKPWLDSIGSVVTGRPPLQWKDEDLLKFEHEMAAYSSKIRKYEQLALAVGKKIVSIEDQIAQISVTSNRTAEKSKVYHVEASNKPIVASLKKELLDKIKNSASSDDLDIVLAALSETALDFMNKFSDIKSNKRI